MRGSMRRYRIARELWASAAGMGTGNIAGMARSGDGRTYARHAKDSMRWQSAGKGEMSGISGRTASGDLTAICEKEIFQEEGVTGSGTWAYFNPVYPPRYET